MKRRLTYFSTLVLVMSFAISPFALHGLFAQDAAVQEKKQEEGNPSVGDLMREGRKLMGKRDFDAAAKLFQKVVEQDAENGQAWHLLGYSLHMAGDLDAALKAHKKASEADDQQTKSLGFYNMACVYSLQKKADEAFACLNNAIDAGFRDKGQIDGDSDLDNIRDDDRLAEVIALIKKDGKRTVTRKKTPSLMGTWKVDSGVVLGNDPSQLPLLIKVTKDEISSDTPKGTLVFTYEIDRTKKPIQIDMTMEEGPQPDAKAKGIIRFDGETATLCYHPMGGNRPKDFESTEENQFHMFVMKKQVLKIGAGTLVGDWQYVSGTNSGSEVGQESIAALVKIGKNKITLPAGPEKLVMAYKIDASKSPVEIDMEMISGPGAEPGSPTIGILKAEGENIVICYDPTGTERPKKFESTKGDQFHLFEIKKIVID